MTGLRDGAAAPDIPGGVSLGNCPLCGGSNFVAEREVLQRCSACGLVVNPAIWSHGAEEALEREWFDDDVRIDRSAWTRLFERWSNARTLDRLVQSGKRAGNVLEVGVGSGALLATLRDAGFIVEGCDLSLALAEHTRAAHGIFVHEQPLDALPDGRSYDVIIMNHVVEHVGDPVALLKSARSRLAPGGLLHIACPNIDSWDAKLPGWISYQPYHLAYFTPTTLRRAAVQAGLRVRTIETHEPFSGWSLAMLRTIRGASVTDAVKTGNVRRAADAPSAVAHLYRTALVAAGTVTWPLRVMQSRLARGEELVLLAERS
jgi:2-polyprenyl-3-methyl-5-hydroxy-6-metoxy-1,4-benzoquinol methylase